MTKKQKITDQLGSMYKKISFQSKKTSSTTTTATDPMTDLFQQSMRTNQTPEPYMKNMLRQRF